VRALLIVVPDVLVDDSFEVTFAEDEDVVQALPPDGPREALGKSTCFG